MSSSTNTHGGTMDPPLLPLPPDTWYDERIKENFSTMKDEYMAKGYGVTLEWLQEQKPKIVQAVLNYANNLKTPHNNRVLVTTAVLDLNIPGLERLDWRKTGVRDDWGSQALAAYGRRWAETTMFYHSDSPFWIQNPQSEKEGPYADNQNWTHKKQTCTPEKRLDVSQLRRKINIMYQDTTRRKKYQNIPLEASALFDTGMNMFTTDLLKHQINLNIPVVLTDREIYFSGHKQENSPITDDAHLTRVFRAIWEEKSDKDAADVTTWVTILAKKRE